jgi:cytochrome c
MAIARAIFACLAIATATPALADGNVAAGEVVFKKCLVCHTNEEGKNKIGPSLWDIVGRHSASVPNYPYSEAMKKFDKTWTDDELFTYLAAPMKVVKGTKMAFPGLPSEEDRHNLIAYLETLK